MSTRSDIIVKHPLGEIKFYHHYDGYPEGVGFQLVELIDSFPISKPYCEGDEVDEALNLNTFVHALTDIKDGGEYEFTEYRHVDIQFRYIIDIKTRKLQCLEGYYEYDEAADGEETCEFVAHKSHDVRKLYGAAKAKEAVSEQSSTKSKY